LGESGGITQPNAITPIEYLNQLFDYALSIGMTYDQYWYEDTDLLIHYIKAEQYRLKRFNQQAWVQGLYVYQAIGCLVPILNPLSKEHKARPYLKEPFPSSKEEVEERRLKRIQAWTNMMMSKVKRDEKEV